ncbi:MAG: glutamyl-tRNA reductase [Spirochaetales bacterium]|nr:glutamyl-tRNA reductase [Spirochaetales bacterium]
MIGVVGINHETAPLDIRGQLCFNTEEIQQFFKYLQNKQKNFEAVLVSTCNRTELYFYLPKSCENGIFREIISSLIGFKGIDQNQDFHFYTHTDLKAVKHLFNVAAGLNSMILGENQILGQLKKAYKISIDLNLTGSIMNRLFHNAFRAGKRVRSETNINKGASSISYAAVELTHKVFSCLHDHPVLLIGAGETGDLVLQSLKERGSGQIEITNRTYEKAEVLAEKYNATAVSFDCLNKALERADIIITSTTSNKPIINKNQIVTIIKKRKNKTLLLIDLSVPRNIEESIRSVNNVFLFNLDDLQEVVTFNHNKRQSSIQKADMIVQEMVDEFESWLSGLVLAPTIDQLKEKLSTLMETELNKVLSSSSPEEENCFQMYSTGIHQKYLDLIIKNLKKLSDNGKNVECIDLVNKLFDLDIGDRKKTDNTLEIWESS